MDKTTPFEDYISAQAEMENAVLNKVNPHFKSNYADLSSVRAATLPALTKYGLGIIQMPTLVEGQMMLISRLVHKSGVVVQECQYPLTVSGSPQQRGSEITYARRYTWASLCGIASDEDDDANQAESAPKRTPAAARQAPPANTEEWHGPLNKTALKAQSREIGHTIMGCTDDDQLEAYLATDEVKTHIEQLSVDLPEWWEGDGGDKRGLAGIINQRRSELQNNFPGDLPITAAG